MDSKQTTKLRFHPAWVFVGWAMVCLVVYMSLSTLGAEAVSGLLNDKITHMLGYFCLMLWFAQFYKANGTRMFYSCLFIAMGVALEYLQGLGGTRMFEVADMVANTAGVLLGWLFAAMGMDRLLLWFEAKVFGKP